jgi:hypothetical protein
MGDIDRELGKVDSDIKQGRQYLESSAARLEQMAPEVMRYAELFKEYEAQQKQLYAQGRTKEGNALADEYNTVHRPRRMAISAAFLQQHQNYEQVERKLTALNARRSELVAHRDRIQLNKSATAERLQQLAGSQEGRDRVFDARGGSGTPVSKSEVPPVGPAGPVSPPPPDPR